MIYLSIFVLFYSLIKTEQLICLSNCSNVYVKHDGSIRPNTCLKTTSEICKAQIIAYYDGKTIPNYFNYTFGFTGDIQEEEHKQFIKGYGLISFTEYQFIVHAKEDKTILIADIYCTKNDDCGYIRLQQLFQKYNHQINPSYQFKSFIYSDSLPTKLTCYDSKSRTNIQCSSFNNPVCISNSTDSIQECSSRLDVYAHYTFTISSPDIIVSKRTTELIICNKDHCNEDRLLTQLESITTGYTYDDDTMKTTSTGYSYGDDTMKNIANKQNFNNHHMLFGLLVTIVYYIA